MSHESDRIAARAAEYLIGSREETPVQRQEREAWLEADPRHRKAYQQLQKFDERAVLPDDPELRALPERDLETLQRSRRLWRSLAWLILLLLLLFVAAYLTGAFSTV